MSNFVKFVLVACLLSGLAFAQDTTQSASPAPTPQKQARRDQAQRRLQHLSQQLNLTDDQKEKLRPIIQDEVQQMKSVHDDSSLTQQQRHRKMRQIHESFRPQIEAVLTPEQKQKLEMMQRDRGGHQHMRHNQTAPGAGPGNTSPQ